MIDASKLPRVSSQFIAEAGQAAADESQAAVAATGATELGGVARGQEVSATPKTMAFQDGRYYVVSEQK